MKTLFVKWTLSAALLAHCCSSGRGLSEELPAAPDRIAQWVKALEDDDYDSRTKASEELIKMGKPALSVLRKAGLDTLEGKTRTEQIMQKIVQAHTAEALENNPGLNGSGFTNQPLAFKALNCQTGLKLAFPKHRFYLVSKSEEQPPFGVMFLTPEDKIMGYLLKEDHKQKPDSTLSKLIQEAAIKVTNKEEAEKFGLLWLTLAYGCQDFKVINTDHQGETRY